MDMSGEKLLKQNSCYLSEKSNDFSGRIGFVRQEIAENYLKDSEPWVIAYSGGKDSTMTLQLALETIAEEPKKEIHILYADTKVEPPPVIDNAMRLLNKIDTWAKNKGLPVIIKILHPKIEDSFFVLVLGKGYLPPTRWFRWCTERLKVKPIKKYIKSIIKEHGGCVVLLGMRLRESTSRDRGLKKRGYSKWMPFEGLKGAEIYAPILELTIEDVWTYLLNNNPPWGMDNHFLRSLYTGGDSSCSLFCGGIRFGCWVCTVVKKDKCTEGLSKLPEWEWLSMLTEYRDKLLIVRSDPKSRILKRVNGKEYLGPLSLKTRKTLYKELKELEKKMGYSIISAEEEKIIINYLQKEKD
jgi:DNA sulfur modification protein DndC